MVTTIVIAVAMITTAVALVYYLRDKRILTGCACDCESVVVELDGVNREVDLFVDSAHTQFYNAEKGDVSQSSRRLLLVFQYENGEIPMMLAVSRSGVGIVWVEPYILGVLGYKFLVCSPLMDTVCDVRDDMKGLGAVVEKKHAGKYVEYSISRLYKGCLHKIVLKVDAVLYALITDAIDGMADAV